jgi:CheY-like chemotaxis protein
MNAEVSTLLVVDDDADVRRITCLILRQGGYRCVEASSGPEALRLLADSPQTYRLVVTDLKMPEMTGDILAREILNLYPHLKVMLLTGYSGDAVVAMSLDPDRIGLVEKPFGVGALLGQVERLLGSL